MIDLSKLVPPRVWAAVLVLFDADSLKRLDSPRGETLKHIRVRTRHDGVVVTGTDGYVLVEVAWDLDLASAEWLDVVVTLENAIACARGQAVEYDGAGEYPETDTVLRQEATASPWRGSDGVVWCVDAHFLGLPARVADRLELEGTDWIVTHGASALDSVILWCHMRPPCLSEITDRAITAVVIMPRRLPDGLTPPAWRSPQYDSGRRPPDYPDDDIPF